MTVEMQMLVASTILALIHPLPYVFAYLTHWGLAVAAGNRDNVPELPAWAERGRRAHANMTENLVHFGILVLAVIAMDISNPTTAMGATLFFWSRLGFLLVYLAGIVWIRTLFFFGGLVGELMIAWQLATAIW